MSGLEFLRGLAGLWVIALFVVFGFWIYACCIRWLWRRRGQGFAEGWFEVAEKRAQAGAGLPEKPAPQVGAGERSDFPEVVKSQPTPPPPQPGKRPAAGPPRYLVPREDK